MSRKLCPLPMPSPSYFPSREKSKQRSNKAEEQGGGDGQAAVKAAAWAWLERESNQPDMAEYWRARMVLKPPPPRPSRYKKEAQERINNVETHRKPLMDAYEIETITKQIENLVASSTSRAERDHEDQVKERKRVRGRLVMCGRIEDVVDDAIRLSRRHRSHEFIRDHASVVLRRSSFLSSEQSSL